MINKRIILDTDLGSDCDDVMAIAYLLYAKKFLNVDILAVTHCLKTPYGVPAIRSIFRGFNEEIPPVGKMEGGADLKDWYAEGLANAFASPEDYLDAQTATKVLRKALVSTSEKCVICAVGQFTNISALLKSKPDEISNLDGVSLVKEKCSELVLMACKFIDEEDGTRTGEWNVKWDVPATKTVMELSPVDITLLPSEVGIKVITGYEAMKKYGESNPLTKAFHIYPFAKTGRSSWDPMTAVYAIEGVKEFFVKGEKGDVTFKENGASYFTANPNGKCSVLSFNYANYNSEQECINSVGKYIDDCAEKYISSKN